MTVFITGGSGCGKSALAERAAAALGGELVYLATMPVRTAEDEKKVSRHHTLRAGRGFATLERPGCLSPLPPEDATVLLECLSTFTANRMFSGEAAPNWEERLWSELTPLLERRGHTVVVSAQADGDGVDYGPETNEYRRVLGALNRRLASYSDAAAECVCGIPVMLKGELPC